MPNMDAQKKPVTDWHRADIKAELEKRGYSLSRLARTNGYARRSASQALFMPWPKMERLIADAIGVEPKDIWPSRYHEDGTPKQRSIKQLQHSIKDTSASEGGNVDVKRGYRHGPRARSAHV